MESSAEELLLSSEVSLSLFSFGLRDGDLKSMAQNCQNNSELGQFLCIIHENTNDYIIIILFSLEISGMDLCTFFCCRLFWSLGQRCASHKFHTVHVLRAQIGPGPPTVSQLWLWRSPLFAAPPPPPRPPVQGPAWKCSICILVIFDSDFEVF